MKKSMKYMALTGVGLLVAGALLGLCGFAAGGTPWIYADSTGIHVGDTEKRDFQIREELAAFDALSVNVGLADVYVVEGDGYAIDIQYTGSFHEPTYSLEEGVLTIGDQTPSGSSPVWQILNFNLLGTDGGGSNRIVVTVPASASLERMELYSDMGEIQCAHGAEELVISSSLGEVALRDAQAGKVTVTADCGSCEIVNLTADSLNLTDNLGSAVLHQVNCDAFTADMESGSLTVDDSSLGKVDVENSLGDVIFDQVSTDGMEIQCENGSMELTGAFQGISRLLNNLGDVKVTASLPKDSYRYEMTLDLGSAYVDGEQVTGGNLFGGSEGAANRLEVQAELGSVWLYFPA